MNRGMLRGIGPTPFLPEYTGSGDPANWGAVPYVDASQSGRIALARGSLPVEPSGDPSGVTDRINILRAMNAVGRDGAAVQLLPRMGKYWIDRPLLWDTSGSAVTTLAPSILGHVGLAGVASGVATDIGVVEIQCAPSFPAGEFMIDYLGPADPNSDAGNIGQTIRGLRLMNAFLGAGMRDFNGVSTWDGIESQDTHTPAPANNAGSPVGNFNVVSNPVWASYWSQLSRCYSHQAGNQAFHINIGGGNIASLFNCWEDFSGGSGYEIHYDVNLIGCYAQSNGLNGWGGADFLLYGGGQLIGCTVTAGSTSYCNAVRILGQLTSTTAIIGGQFYGTTRAGGTEAQSAVLRVAPNNAADVLVVGAHFTSQLAASDWLYSDSGTTGTAHFLSSRFYGTPTTAVNDIAGIFDFEDCYGIPDTEGMPPVSLPATQLWRLANNRQAMFSHAIACGSGSRIQLNDGSALVGAI